MPGCTACLSEPRHDTNPPGAPRPPQGPPRRAPRLPTPRLPTPRLPAPRLPAPRLPARCLPHLHRLVACRIRTREACRPVSATPPPPSLLACAKRCDSAPSRLLEHATLRHLCDRVRLCTYAFSAPQQTAHTHGVPSHPSHPWLNPLSPPPSPHTPQKATSQTLNKPRSAASLHHNT